MIPNMKRRREAASVHSAGTMVACSLGLTWLLCGSLANAAPLTLANVIERATASYAAVRAAHANVEVARAEAQIAEGGFDTIWKGRVVATPFDYYDQLRIDTTLEKPLPWLGAQAFVGWRLGLGAFAAYDGKQVTRPGGEVRAGLIASLLRHRATDRRRTNVAKAEAGVSIANHELRQEYLQTRRQAAHRYWNWVAAGLKLRLAEELLGAAQVRDQGLRNRVTSGDLPQIDQLDNARSIAQRQAAVLQAARAVDQAALELAVLLAAPSGDLAPPALTDLPSSIPAPPLPRPIAIDAALARRPELAKLQAQRHQQQVERRLADNQLLPALDLGLSASHDVGEPIAARPDLDRPQVEAALTLEVPLERRLLRGRQAQASALAQRLDLQYRLAWSRAEAELRNADAAITTAHARLAQILQEAELASQVEAGERERYARGESTLLAVTIRELQTLEARQRLVDGQADCWRAAADLDAAQATP